MTELLGADVSVVQGLVDWGRFKAEGRVWAYDKCGGGVTGSDARWISNAASCRAAGVPFGAYCVFVPGDDPEAQAKAWWAASGGCGSHPGELPIAIDFEEASQTMTPAAECAALCTVIAVLTAEQGRPPTLYTYPIFWSRIVSVATLAQLTLIATCTLWYASYQAMPPAPPKPWTVATFWQRSGGTNGFRTPGGAPCDDDVFLGDQAALDALTSFSANAAPDPLAGVPVPGLIIDGENA